MTTRLLTITRDALSLPDLVIGSDPTQPFWIPEDGIAEPTFDWRVTYAPQSRYIGGQQKLAAARDADTITAANLYIRGTDAADLRNNMNILINALGQWGYETTLTLDGQALGPYDSDPCAPRFTQDSGMAAANLATAAFAIPVNP